jgi:hypothetical protein
MLLIKNAVTLYRKNAAVSTGIAPIVSEKARLEMEVLGSAGISPAV